MMIEKNNDKIVVNDIGGIHKNGKTFNTGFDKLKQIADSVKIPLIVYLHPEIVEIERGPYNLQGERIIEWCEKKVFCSLKN